MTAVIENLDPLLRALGTTVLILVISAAGSLVLGVLITVARVSPIPVLRGAAWAYVQVFVNVPLLALLLLAVFALPDAGLLMPLTTTVIVVLTVYEAAYVAEAVR
ncbi:ABC transporter permease subunit, partial [Modestobacter sp. KNN46-3]